MTGMSDYTAQRLLNWVVGKTAMPALPSGFLALFTAVGTDAGGFTEPVGNGYARAAFAGTDWNAASGSAPSTNSNVNPINFPTTTGSGWGNTLAWGIWDSLSSGNLLYWDFLGYDPWFPCSITLASPGVITAPGVTAGSIPTLVNSALVVFTAEYGGTLPTAIVQYTQYAVAGLSGDVFNVGVNTATAGAGMVRQLTVQSIPVNVTPSFAGGTPGQLVLLAA